MSVWTDADALFAYVYRTAHVGVMAGRRAVVRADGRRASGAVVDRSRHLPTVADALAKLWLLDNFGPSPQAFTFKARFPAPGLAGPPVDMNPEPWCVGRA